MYLSILIYLIAIAIFIWGGKFSGFKKFHENPYGIDVTMSLRGFAAALIPIHHISQEEQIQSAGTYSFFLHAGYGLVAIFLFCSGYGLIQGLKNKDNYLQGFFKKRLLTLIVPFYTSAVIYSVFNVLTHQRGDSIPRIVCDVLGLTIANSYAWFPIVLTLLYIAFYLIFRKCKNYNLGIVGIVVFVLILNVIFGLNGHFTWWAGPKNWWMTGAVPRQWWMEEQVFWFSGEWWVNSAIAFPVGMLFAQNEKGLLTWFKKLYWLKLVIMVALVAVTRYLSTMAQWKRGYWSEYSFNGAGVMDKMVCLAAQIPEVIAFTFLIAMILMKYHMANPVTRFLGKYSFEFYLMNLIAITISRPILATRPLPYVASFNLNFLLYTVVVVLITLLLGVLVKLLNDMILRMIRR